MRNNSPFEGSELSSGVQRIQEFLAVLVWKALHLTEREARFACNGLIGLLRNWERGRLEAEKASRWSGLGEIMVPRGQYLENTAALACNTQTARLGLGVSALLLAHRLNHGEFPHDLKDLNSELDLSLFEWNSSNGELLVLIPPNLPEGVWKCGTNETGWIRRVPRGLLFLLNPGATSHIV